MDVRLPAFSPSSSFAGWWGIGFEHPASETRALRRNAFHIFEPAFGLGERNQRLQLLDGVSLEHKQPVWLLLMFDGAGVDDLVHGVECCPANSSVAVCDDLRRVGQS